MEELKACLEKTASDELAGADKNVSKETVRVRVLKRVLLSLDMNDEDARLVTRGPPEVAFVHPQVSAYLARHVPVDSALFSDDARDRAVVRKMYSADYHPAADAIAYCDLMDEKARDDSALRRHLQVAFAVDGFRGNAFRDYLENLRRPLREVPVGELDWEERLGGGARKDAERPFEVAHVGAVRFLYENNVPFRSEIMSLAVGKALDSATSTESRVNALARDYERYVGTLLEPIKKWIESTYLCFEKGEEA